MNDYSTSIRKKGAPSTLQDDASVQCCATVHHYTFVVTLGCTLSITLKVVVVVVIMHFGSKEATLNCAQLQ